MLALRRPQKTRILKLHSFPRRTVFCDTSRIYRHMSLKQNRITPLASPSFISTTRRPVKEILFNMSLCAIWLFPTQRDTRGSLCSLCSFPTCAYVAVEHQCLLWWAPVFLRRSKKQAVLRSKRAAAMLA